jgi:hypothetical protein
MDTYIRGKVYIFNFYDILYDVIGKSEFQSAYVNYAGQVYLQKEHLNKIMLAHVRLI